MEKKQVAEAKVQVTPSVESHPQQKQHPKSLGNVCVCVCVCECVCVCVCKSIKMLYNHFGKLAIATRTKHVHTPSSNNLTLEYILKELRSYVYRKVCTRMFIAALFNILETGNNVHLHGQ